MVKLQVNGAAHEVDVDPSTPLLYVLRNDLDLHGPRFGCGLGQCGACSVIIDGEAMRSCITPVSAVQRRDHHARRPVEGRQAASAAAGLDRRAGAAVRLLPERPDHDCQGAARPESESDRRRDPHGHGGRAVPLHDLLPHPGGDQARGAAAQRQPGKASEHHTATAEGGGGRARRARLTASRRSFLKASGALVVSLGVSAPARRRSARERPAAPVRIPIRTSCSSIRGS